MAADWFPKRIVYSVPGMDRVRVERDVTYRTVIAKLYQVDRLVCTR